MAKSFYKKYNSMTKDDQENWLKEAPDANAKTVAEVLTKNALRAIWIQTI